MSVHGPAVALAEHDDRVVLHRRVPELRPQQRRVQRQRAEQPVREVEQMHALVDQLAAAGARRVGAPLALVARPAAVAVARRACAARRRGGPSAPRPPRGRCPDGSDG